MERLEGDGSVSEEGRRGDSVKTMDFYYLSDPQTIFDWSAIRDGFRRRLDLVPIKSLAIAYGLSCTVGYRDNVFVEVVDTFVGMLDDPVRTRFDLAYIIGSSFWDHYDMWHFENIHPEDPGYVGDMLDDFHGKILGWVLDGLSAYSDVPEVMDNAYFLVSRIGNYDTFFEEEDILLMEAAAGKEISINTSEGGRKLIELLSDTFKKMRDGGEMDHDEPDRSSSQDSEEMQ